MVFGNPWEFCNSDRLLLLHMLFYSQKDINLYLPGEARDLSLSGFNFKPITFKGKAQFGAIKNYG